MKRLILLLLAVYPLAATEYAVSYDVTATSSVLTIQQPATGAKNVRGQEVTITCVTQACDVELERDGTAATATAGTIVGVDRNAPAATVKAWTASDVGNGTTIVLHRLTAGSWITLSLKSIFLNGSGTAKNFTIRVTPAASSRVLTNLLLDEN